MEQDYAKIEHLHPAPQAKRKASLTGVVVETVNAGSAGPVHVVRDDLLPGGTKQRACMPYLSKLAQDGWSEFIYASPFCGFAQVALAVACEALNLSCRIFCEKTQSEHPQFHAYSLKAAVHGAEIHLCDTLTEAEESAQNYALEGEDRFKLPLGFNSDEFRRQLSYQLGGAWDNLISQLGHSPKRVWLPVGSGTLTRTFRRLLPESTELLCVDVHVLEENDERITMLTEQPNVTLFSAEEAFKDQTKSWPPLPSNVHYDAKLWRFICQHGQAGDLWWNVGP